MVNVAVAQFTAAVLSFSLSLSLSLSVWTLNVLQMTSLQVQSDPRMSGTEFASRAVDRLSGFISAALWLWLITFPLFVRFQAFCGYAALSCKTMSTRTDTDRDATNWAVELEFCLGANSATLRKAGLNLLWL